MTGDTDGSRWPAVRAQSNVVGVALLMGITVVALAGLTAGIGSLVAHNAASADAERVAADLDAALAPVETTGRHRGRVSFTGGRLETVDRDLWVLDGSGVVAHVEAGGLVFERGERRVAVVGGAIVRSSGESAWLERPPPLTVDRAGHVFLVGAPKLNGSDVAVSGEGGTTVTLRTRVTHRRVRLGNGTYAVAIETATPDAFARWFRKQNATVGRDDVDGDGLESVVARFPGNRTGYLVVHDVHLEVNRE